MSQASPYSAGAALGANVTSDTACTTCAPVRVRVRVRVRSCEDAPQAVNLGCFLRAGSGVREEAVIVFYKFDLRISF